MTLERFTRTDGVPIWINGDRISHIEPAERGATIHLATQELIDVIASADEVAMAFAADADDLSAGAAALTTDAARATRSSRV